MKPLQQERFFYTVTCSDEDGAFIGRVAEFPSLAAHGKSQEKALREIRTVVEFVIEDLAAEKELIRNRSESVITAGN